MKSARQARGERSFKLDRLVCMGRDGSVAEAWLVERVRAFRALGFFSQSSTSDADLASDVVRRQEKYGRPFDARDPDVGPKILLHGASRVWFQDMEADVCRENQMYVRALAHLSEISRGAFDPQDVVETWETDTGPIRVEFSYDGVRHAVEPEYEDDWLGLEDILADLNRLLAPKGVAFVSLAFDQCAWISVVTPEERAGLKALGVPRGLPWASG
jgi:hypothetical protein